jgi:hypothetical protein
VPGARDEAMADVLFKMRLTISNPNSTVVHLAVVQALFFNVRQPTGTVA